jgi:hypothetical protein
MIKREYYTLSNSSAEQNSKFLNNSSRYSISILVSLIGIYLCPVCGFLQSHFAHPMKKVFPID